MMFTGKIVKSIDPYYKIEFDYYGDKIAISKGYAEVVRKQPKLEITYDSVTSEKLKGVNTSEIELEFANLILNDLLIGKNRDSFTYNQFTQST